LSVIINSMKPILAIFAHPDDEAFGPAGTIAQMAVERDVYLVCVTDGGAGMNEGDKGDLGDIRRRELGESAEILGVKQVFFLDYPDGSLSNSVYHEIAEKIQKIVDDVQPEVLLTFEPRGMTGHLDHIAVSMITSFVFEKSPNVLEVWQYCLDQQQRKAFGNDYFIYAPEGYTKEEISKMVDVSDVWDKKLEAINKHQSQKHDIEGFLKQNKDLPKVENFIIRRKP
jgi:LmbE family N-acetylglucosaminyl deacetylase